MSQRTLTRHLLAWALGALALVWASFIAAGYYAGLHESDELTDGHLASVASLLLAYTDGEFTPGRQNLAPPGTLALKAHDYQQSMSVVVWDAAGRVLTRTGDAPLPVFSQVDGFITLQLGAPALPWRAFSRWNDSHGRKVMVLLSVRERDDLAEDIAEQITEPGLWLLPVVALLLGLAIHRGLRPLYVLSREVDALDILQARPLTVTASHEEFRTMVQAINTLVARYHAALTRERALANEFAHELRTPLAAIALHARALRDEPAQLAQAGALAQLERDALRAGEVLSHLLALARASRTELAESAQPLDLLELTRAMLAEFAPAADQSGHELALIGEASFIVKGHAVLLELAVRNLVENAITHTPRGSLVQVQLDPSARWLQVSNRIRQAQMPAASTLQGDGVHALRLGLGHRVVEKIALIHNARFEQLPPSPDYSACYRLTFEALTPDLLPGT